MQHVTKASRPSENLKVGRDSKHPPYLRSLVVMVHSINVCNNSELFWELKLSVTIRPPTDEDNEGLDREHDEKKVAFQAWSLHIRLAFPRRDANTTLYSRGMDHH